jgi:hypothetical protein
VRAAAPAPLHPRPETSAACDVCSASSGEWHATCRARLTLWKVSWYGLLMYARGSVDVWKILSWTPPRCLPDRAAVSRTAPQFNTRQLLFTAMVRAEADKRAELLRTFEDRLEKSITAVMPAFVRRRALAFAALRAARGGSLRQVSASSVLERVDQLSKTVAVRRLTGEGGQTHGAFLLPAG